MKKLLLLLIAGCFVASPALAVTGDYGWEDCGTVLGMYPDDAYIATNVGDPVHSGAASLKLERTSGSTPQAYVAWITGLTDGDVIEVCFWVYDTTPSGEVPKGRIWGHYSTSADITDYQGSAGGNSTYSAGPGWDQLCHTWTFDSSAGTRDALVVEARTYSNPGDTIWVDDITVTAPDGATIHFPPAGPTAVESVSWSNVKALFH
ncbi:MAG: hypothetical protein KAW17_08000 [Candidatus Eisenbacteria sp.]|nr:hypothetical protein [Candidatus Eisenbacteria bacterium]